MHEKDRGWIPEHKVLIPKNAEVIHINWLEAKDPTDLNMLKASPQKEWTPQPISDMKNTRESRFLVSYARNAWNNISVSGFRNHIATAVVSILLSGGVYLKMDQENSQKDHELAQKTQELVRVRSDLRTATGKIDWYEARFKTMEARFKTMEGKMAGFEQKKATENPLPQVAPDNAAELEAQKIAKQRALELERQTAEALWKIAQYEETLAKMRASLEGWKATKAEKAPKQRDFLSIGGVPDDSIQVVARRLVKPQPHAVPWVMNNTLKKRLESIAHDNLIAFGNNGMSQDGQYTMRAVQTSPGVWALYLTSGKHSAKPIYCSDDTKKSALEERIERAKNEILMKLTPEG